MSTTNPPSIVTGAVRLAYIHGWEPNSING